MTTQFTFHALNVSKVHVAKALMAVVIVLGVTHEARAQRLLIVSAGDSYASGEGAPDQREEGWRWKGDNYDGAALSCHRSNRAAAADAARRLNQQWPVDFASVACSGAETGAGPFDVQHPLDGAGAILNGSKSLLGNSGQLASIYRRFTANPYYPSQPARVIDGLVLSIGGNDIGFDKLVQLCMSNSDCRVDGAGYVAQKFVELPNRLRQVIDAVNRGDAGTVRHVFLVQYPDPTTGIGGWRCGAPWVGSPEGPFPTISEQEATWASTAVVAPLNAILANAVEEANAGSGPEWHLVDGVVAQFQGHGYCNVPEYRYINTTLDSLWNQGDIFGTMHPNAMGQWAIANALTSTMSFLPQPKAQFVSQSVPSTMLPGHTYPVSVTMRNTGSAAWTPQYSIRLGSQAPQDNWTWGFNRVELPGRVEPGEDATFSFVVTAPLNQGNYTFQWRMVHELVEWFGAFTPPVTVNVPSLNRQMSVRVVQNSITLTTANITVYATDTVTGLPVSASVLLNGTVVGQAGQPFTYTRLRVRNCEVINGKPICFTEFVTQDFEVAAGGYDAVWFARE